MEQRTPWCKDANIIKQAQDTCKEHEIQLKKALSFGQDFPVIIILLNDMADINEQPTAEIISTQSLRGIDIVTRYIGASVGRPVTFNIANLHDTHTDDLLDAPILYLAGTQPLELSPVDEAKLKRFSENGGLILGNPDGGSERFLKSFQKLASKLFPMYEMRTLPADHPIYMHEQFRGDDIKSKDKLLGLSNGVRELMIIPTVDWASAWQGDRFASQDDFRLAANIYLYTVGRTSFPHGGPGVVHPNKAVTAATTIKLARLDYAGNANPEPAGWQRLAAILHNHNSIDLEIQTVNLGTGQLGGFKLAHLTGTGGLLLMHSNGRRFKSLLKAAVPC